MKIFLTAIFFLFLSNCSFDNKTGIWQNTNDTKSKKTNKFKDFKKIKSKDIFFNDIIKPDKKLKIILEPIKTNLNWLDEYYQNSNNLDNFSYKDTNEFIFKSKKLSKNKTQERILYKDQNVIIVDEKGSVIVYSIENQQIIFNYNFYKKKFKKIKKQLSIIIEKNIIYVSDNLGYVYALDYVNQKMLWAQDYKVPFRSNIKISDKKLFLADINNSLYFINKINGKKIKIIPTEEVLIKNNFVNSLSFNKDTLFYLNTYGSLYSISTNGKINWFINLNQSLDINPSNLFYSNPIIHHQDKLIISTDMYLYIINSNNGSTISKISINTAIKPVISGKNLFLITIDNLLVYINLETGEIIYSIDINQDISEFLNSKKKSLSIKTLAIVNNDLYLFLNNSYFVKFIPTGTIKSIVKLSSPPQSLPIFINESILYLDYKNKLIINN